MHRLIVQKIKDSREKKGVTQQQMADTIHVDLSTYKRIEKSDSVTWAKYLEVILKTLEISQEDFFRDLGTNVSNTNGNVTFDKHVLTIESVLRENKEKSDKIIELFEERLKEKDALNFEKDRLIKELNEISELKDKIIEELKRI